MPSGMETDRNRAELDRLAIADGLAACGEIGAASDSHDGERFARRENVAVARPRMIRMPMRDERACNRPHGVDVKIPGRAIKAGRGE